jgi:cell wall-associated NlpC family hydrolase
MVLSEQFEIELPDYADAYSCTHDQDSVSAAVRAGLRDGWTKLDRKHMKPHAGDLLIIKIAGRPWHCGLMVTPDKFLHCPTQKDRATGQEIGTSCWERLDNVIWTRRIEGIYRHV